MLKVACLKIGASPNPIERKQPLKELNEFSESGARLQNFLALVILIDALVNDAIGPASGVVVTSLMVF